MTQINRAQIKETAKSYLKAPLIGGMMGAVAIYLAIATFGGMLPVVGGFAGIFAMILMLNLEELFYNVRMTGQPISAGKVFSFGSTWRIFLGKLWSTLKIWPAWLLLIGGAIIMFVSIPFLTLGAAEEEAGMAIVGLLIMGVGYCAMMASIPVSIVMSLNYVLTTYIILDNPEMSPSDAADLSKDMMKGRKGEWFILQLSFLGWDILTGMTLNILGIYTIPYKYQTFIGYYLEYKNQGFNRTAQ